MPFSFSTWHWGLLWDALIPLAHIISINGKIMENPANTYSSIHRDMYVWECDVCMFNVYMCAHISTLLILSFTDARQIAQNFICRQKRANDWTFICVLSPYPMYSIHAYFVNHFSVLHIHTHTQTIRKSENSLPFYFIFFLFFFKFGK